MTGPPVRHACVTYPLRVVSQVLLTTILVMMVGCAPTTRLRIMMRLPEPQRELFQQRIIKPFEKKHNCIVNVDTYESVEEMRDRLDNLPDSLQPDLIELPFEMATPLARSGRVVPWDGVLSAKRALTLHDELFFSELGRVDGQQFFWPRHLETPLLLFLKSRVTEASRFWDNRRGDLAVHLRNLGLLDLPSNYRLESNPAAWDKLDLFVAASFWRDLEVKGWRRPRLAMGIGSPHEAALSLMNQALQAGAQSDQLLHLSEPPILAAMRWQQAFCREGLLRPGSYHGETLDSLGVALQNGEVFLAEVTPREAFLIHGDGSPQLPGYLPDPADMGITPLPKGMWPADANQTRFHDGKRGASTRVWMWGLGRVGAEKEKAGDLLLHLSSTPSLVAEASTFGLIPARRDVLSELPLIFGSGWAGEVYQATARQMIENGRAIPPQVESFPEVAQIWYQANQEACDPAQANMTWDETAKRLQEQYGPRLETLMGSQDPQAKAPLSGMR